MSCTCSECKYEGTKVCALCSNYMGVPDCWEAKPKTRGDKIRNLDDERLAIFLEKVGLDPSISREFWLQWLQQEAEL